MDKSIAASILIVLLVIGLIRILENTKSISKKIIFSDELGKKFAEYLNSNGEDSGAYSWLIQKSETLQRNMGWYGIIANFSIPYPQQKVKNYQVVLNAIPAIHEEFGWDTVNPQLIRKYANLLRECVLRYRGDLLNKLEAGQKNKKNPLSWLREGVSWLFLLPFSILSWVGLLGKATLDKIAENPIGTIIVNLATLVGLISSLVTIVLGWGEFIKILQALFT